MEEAKAESKPLPAGPFQKLPVEITRVILSAVSDIKSLRSVALSCSLLRNTFLDDEEKITTSVLHREIDPDVLPEAVATLASSQLNVHDANSSTRDKSYQQISDFVLEHLRTRKAAPTSYSFRDAWPISKLHAVVDRLSKHFAGEALRSLSVATGGRGQATSTPSPQETARIQRAFYRFEIYCNLFRSTGLCGENESVVIDEQAHLFMNNFALWELEQLGCIHDFLFRVVLPAYNDVAEHDVFWGSKQIEHAFDDDTSLPEIQHVLSTGLKRLSLLSTTNAYGPRYILLNLSSIVTMGSRLPLRADFFLFHGLKHASRPFTFVSGELNITNRFIRQPFFADTDSGPKDAWEWTHITDQNGIPNGIQRDGWVFRRSHAGLRKTGYTFWDRDRLLQVGLPKDPSACAGLIPREGFLSAASVMMRASWVVRAHIYHSGGSGWWSKDDETKIK